MPTQAELTDKFLRRQVLAIDAEIGELADRLAALEKDRETVEGTIQILNKDMPALPPPSGEPEHGIAPRAEEPPPPVEEPPPSAKVPPHVAPTGGRHKGRHRFRPLGDPNGVCTLDGCDAKGDTAQYGRRGRRQTPARSGAAEAPARRTPDPALVAKLSGEGEQPPPSPPAGADGSGKVYDKKQVSAAGDACPRCSAYPVSEGTVGVHGKRFSCPGPDCDWKSWTIPGVAGAS